LLEHVDGVDILAPLLVDQCLLLLDAHEVLGCAQWLLVRQERLVGLCCVHRRSIVVEVEVGLNRVDIASADLDPRNVANCFPKGWWV